MGPSPSWTPLLNLRLMAPYLSLCTGNPHTDQYLQWDSHHHLSAKFSVIHTLSNRATAVCSKPELLQQEKDHLRKAVTNANIPNGLWTRWRKDSICLPVRSMMGLTTKALQLPNLSPMKSKIRVILSYPTHKVFVKVSKRSVVDMAFKPTSNVAGPSKASWSSPRIMSLWSTKVVPSIGTNLVT